MLARAKEAGLNVQKMDCLQFLQNQADQSLIALTGFHIAEHLPFEVLQQLVMHTLRVLKPGGLLILETPNPENVSVGTCSFYMDPTHNHPLPPPLLEFLPIHYGFNRAITVRLQEKEALKSPDAAVNLIDVLKGVSPDYSIIAQKAAPEDILERFETLFTQQYGLTLDALSNRYDAILRQQFSSFASQLETLNRTYTRQISKMSETIQTLQGQVDELNHVIGQNHQLHQQMADLHNSRSWRITQPLRWLSLQRQLLRQEGAKVRARRAAKKILRKGMALSLVFFHRYPKSKVYLFKVLRKTGCYTLLQRLFQRVMLVHSDTMMMQSRRYDVGTEEMTSRALSIYNELKNKNTEK